MDNKKKVIPQDNLTATQLDEHGRSKYAVFLPALSGFFATYVGKQRFDPNYVEPARVPADYENGVEGMNWLNPQQGYFTYKWSLYSAGHAELDLSKVAPKEDMVRNRDPGSLIVGDSGGFQVGKGVWEGEWNDPTGPEVAQRMADAIAKGVELIPQVDASGSPILDKNGVQKTTKIDHAKIYQARLDAAQKKREQVLAWMDGLMDYGMVLDIPAWVGRSPVGSKNTGIMDYDQAVTATKYNNEYFIKHRTGKCKFLNVLQGENHTQADDWYEKMKHFCDPTKYDKPFDGWAMGGQNMCDVHLILKRLVALRHDNLLQQGRHDWMHFLGTSKLEWAVLLTDIQTAIRKYVNPNFTISFDCASPFLATANGQIYHHVDLPHQQKWCYRMAPSVDNKKYAKDTRSFRDAVLQDKILPHFDESPISARTKVKDVCIYAPGDLNKIGKEGKTSWDSFSYAIQMAHNVWTHIYAVQEANRRYEAGEYPAMMRRDGGDYVMFKDVVDAIFATNDRAESEAIIDMYDGYWMEIVGTRGFKGKKTKNSLTKFNELFAIDEPEGIQPTQMAPDIEVDLDESKLNDLDTASEKE